MSIDLRRFLSQSELCHGCEEEETCFTLAARGVYDWLTLGQELCELQDDWFLGLQSQEVWVGFSLQVCFLF